MWNLAINRLYYSSYYAIIALLLCIDIIPKTHKGTNISFNNYFIKTGQISYNLGKLFSSLFDARQDADYKDFIEYTEEDVIPLIEKTKNFIDTISSYIKENYF